MTLFVNNQNLPLLVITRRVLAIVSGAFITIHAEYDDAGVTYQVIEVTNADPNVVQSVLSTPITVEESASVTRANSSLANMGLVTELKTVTQAQAAAYVAQQITNGVLETTALAQFDSAGTYAAAKPILRNMLVGMYRTVDVLKLIARLLVAIRDYIRPFQD